MNIKQNLKWMELSFSPPVFLQAMYKTWLDVKGSLGLLMDLNTHNENWNLIKVWSNRRRPNLVQTKAMHYCHWMNKVKHHHCVMWGPSRFAFKIFCTCWFHHLMCADAASAHPPNQHPPVCFIFCGWSLESSLWPSCTTSKCHSNMGEQHDSVMWHPGPVIFVPLHYTELLIVSGGIFVPCPWFLYTHATSPSTQPKIISAFCSCFLFCPLACRCYHVCPTP